MWKKEWIEPRDVTVEYRPNLFIEIALAERVQEIIADWSIEN
jgi:hypothetical protein